MSNCVSCGPAVQAYLDSLPNQLSGTMLDKLLFASPIMYDDFISVDPALTNLPFTALLDKRPFPTDQPVYHEIKIHREAGLQFLNNSEYFRQVYDQADCLTDCDWKPNSFSAGRSRRSSVLEKIDFEQEFPCHEGMLKKYEAIKMFLQVPVFLRGYMEQIANDYVRNVFLQKFKKIVITQNGFTANCGNLREFPNLATFDMDGAPIVDGDGNPVCAITGNLTPELLLNFMEQVRIKHGHSIGFQGSSMQLAVGMNPYQWRQKLAESPRFSDYIINNPRLSDAYFDRFMPTDSFGGMLNIIPMDLPRATLDENCTPEFHLQYVNKPDGNGGVRRDVNPQYSEATHGIAIVFAPNVGTLWEEEVIPNARIGDASFGPQYGTKTMQNGKFTWINAYDYHCNPKGLGGKYISTYKTGFHPGDGLEAGYIILYPLTKAEHLVSNLPKGECLVEDSCPEIFLGSDCKCPQPIDCCPITSCKSALKFDTPMAPDAPLAVGDVAQAVITGGGFRDVTVRAIDTETAGGVTIYTYTIETVDGLPLDCKCIQALLVTGSQLCTISPKCESDVQDSNTCRCEEGLYGVELDKCFGAVAGEVYNLHLANGQVLADVTLQEIGPVTDAKTGVSTDFAFFDTPCAAICTAGGVDKVVNPAVTDCDDGLSAEGCDGTEIDLDATGKTSE